MKNLILIEISLMHLSSVESSMDLALFPDKKRDTGF